MTAVTVVHRSSIPGAVLGGDRSVCYVRQEVALGAESEGRGILPPGNSGHVSVGELPALLQGNEPPRLTDQLERYLDGEYKPHPITPTEFEGADREQ